MKAKLLALAALAASFPLHAQVKTEDFGKMPSGETAHLYTLTSPTLKVRLSEYGAAIVSIDAPDKNGHQADVFLGYNNLQQYLDDKNFFGPTIGRYANRLNKGQFTLDGKQYQVPPNNNGNALHGGPMGWGKKLWHGKPVGPNAVEFTLVSPDGDMGFPGTVTAHVKFTLAGKALRIDYSATTDKDTVINLTNHSYFNLAGEASGDDRKQELQIDADQYGPVNSTLIPTGPTAPVAGTPFDFRTLHPIGDHILDNNEQLGFGKGYDHNFILNSKTHTLHPAVMAYDPASGRTLTITTTEPGVQFYSGQGLDASTKGYSGQPLQQYGAFVLETQHFPDSPNQPGYPTTELKPGQAFHSTTVLTFGTKQ